MTIALPSARVTSVPSMSAGRARRRYSLIRTCRRVGPSVRAVLLSGGSLLPHLDGLDVQRSRATAGKLQGRNDIGDGEVGQKVHGLSRYVGRDVQHGIAVDVPRQRPGLPV